MKNPLVLIVVFLALGIPASPRLHAQLYKIIDLDSSGGYNFMAVAINDSSRIIYNGSGFGVPSRGYLWQDSARVDLGTLGGNHTEARGLNNQGEVVGRSWLAGDTTSRAFRWDGTMSGIFTLGGKHSSAQAINDSGQIVGWADEPGDSMRRAVQWRFGTLTQLDGLGGEAAGGLAINNDSVVVGWAERPDTVNDHAVRWVAGSLEDLGNLGVDYVSTATAINDSGKIAGYSSSAAFGLTPFSWENGTMTGLGVNGTASGINDVGDVVGSYFDPGTSRMYACVWQDDFLFDLNLMIPPGSGWYLEAATDINNKGEIVGYGVRNFAGRAFLLKPASIILTEPATDQLMIGGRKDTVRWMSALDPGENVDLWYRLDDGVKWYLIAAGVPSHLEEYVWTVPDTASTRARILVEASSDPTLNDTSAVFRIKGYRLAKLLPSGEYVHYSFDSDRWAFENDTAYVWPASWWSGRFNYFGTDPITGDSFLRGGISTNGFFMGAKSSDFPDWPSWVRTFGVNACYRDPAQFIYSPTAVARWASVKESFGGSCFGFAISNAWAFRDRELVYQRFPAVPAFVSPIGVLPDTNVITMISTLYTHQLGKEHLDYRIQTGLQKTPNQTINDLKRMFLVDGEPLRTFSIVNEGPGGGGHAILAYRLVQDTAQPKLYSIYVYDNSYPNDPTARVIVDTTLNGGTGGWSYSNFAWYGAKGMYLRDPASTYSLTPTLPGQDAGPSSPFTLAAGILDVHVNTDAEVSISDSLGNLTGYVDSLVLAGIPGSIPLIVENGSKTPPYGYRLPDRKSSISINEIAGEYSRAFLFSGNRSFVFERPDATPGQTDRIFFDGNYAVVNPDTQSKTIDLVSIVNNDYLGENSYSIRSLSLGQDDSIRIENLPANGLRLGVFGPASRSYTLSLDFDIYPAARRFTHYAVPLGGNSSHIVQPDWGSLTPGTNLRILIDLGNDGTIDDSMLVANQLTDVRDDGAQTTPSGFALRQNYPNPFNPSTTIGYTVPSTGYVTVKIVDVLGREVAVLSDGVKAPGSYRVEWDASAFPAGVYFCRMQAGDVTLSTKLLLVK